MLDIDKVYKYFTASLVMVSKRGFGLGLDQPFHWIIFGLLLVCLFAVILVNGGALGLPVIGDLSGAPESARILVETFISVATPFVNLLFFIVAPAGEGPNVQMIAFAIFLLLVLVGSKTLKFAFGGKNSLLPFFISVIIGLIAARGLTSTVLQQSALAASPIAAVSLLLGFIPIYALTTNIQRWELGDVAKMGLYATVAFVYYLIFYLAFDSWQLGAVYGIGIIVMGVGGELQTWYYEHKLGAGDRKVGQIMAAIHVDIAEAKEIAEGRKTAMDPRTGRPIRIN